MEMSERILKVKSSDSGYSMIGLRTDGSQVEITHLKGRMLAVPQVAVCLMTWNETYNLIRQYGQTPRKYKFEILEKPKYVGRSTDLKLKVYKFVNNFCVPVIADRIHISEEGKLNQNYVGYIGDLVEFLRYYNDTCNDIFELEVAHHDIYENNTSFDCAGFYGIDHIKISYNNPQQCKEGMVKFAV